MQNIRTVESEILDLDSARYRATMDADREALEALLAPGLVYTHSMGYTETRDEYLDALCSGRVRYLEVERVLTRLQVYDGCAVMHGQVAVSAEVSGRAVSASCLFLSTWVRADGGWQMASWAATPIPSP